ncbi:putative RNA-binding protein 38 [Trypanosoma cruzi]|uniref:RNA-binding protein 38 n=2 Tax=Trypanosoma cruzi TaxID=5693 RepID=Q4DZH8_TRYCC|nr:hypothetical protein, conserved [Trypanosoma cruzi]EAN97924.1 hypothetical protein, conserved [Trypanosoma cruzi]PWU99960.1 putative RNA-binding protein 38 [Trypanosoma cruzi]RNC45796.1 RBP38 protein [Trypanosoma cruzi]|eukprot:XP_819775.1 hypothetical protein [Trypanosoma cruzi strain CL Brener]
MPVHPEFIPLAKQKEMFAISSWRDSPQTAAAAQPMVPSPAILPEAQCDKDGASQVKGGHRSRRGRRGKNRLVQRQQDVDDFFLNCVLPKGVSFATLNSELQCNATMPLRAYDIGTPYALFTRRNCGALSGGMEPGNTENASGSGATATAATGTKAPMPPGGDHSSSTNNNTNNHNPNTTNTVTIAAADARIGTSSSEAEAAVVAIASGDGLATTTKKSNHPAVTFSPFRTPMVGASGAAVLTPADDSDDSPGDAPPPDLVLPPSVPSEILSKGHLISLLYAESGEAEKTSEWLQKKWPQATVMVVARNRSILNSSLVLKGLPSLAKTERIIEEVEKVIPQKPSYIRLHRGERGVFKNVVFVKYPNREVAEESKLRLERFFIGSRQLKVEFKKREKGTAERESEASLQQLVRDLRVSTEHEGFIYQRSDLTKDELKLLKQLCHSYGLSFDLSEQKVTVKRILPGNDRQSPALRPSQTTPLNWTQATPGALRPMDFKGIRHWGEMRSKYSSLGIARPKGPHDVPPFASGRGRPL